MEEMAPKFASQEFKLKRQRILKKISKINLLFYFLAFRYLFSALQNEITT